jgi:hypothetical protein
VASGEKEKSRSLPIRLGTRAACRALVAALGMTRGWGGGAAALLKIAVCQNAQICGGIGRRLRQMRMNELTAKQFSSVPCPTCGVAAGMRCLLYSGTPRTEAHIDRKLSAAEAIETKQLPRRAR